MQQFNSIKTIVLATVILCIHFNNQMKIKHAAAPFTYTLYAMNIPVVWKNIKKHMENPVPPLLNQHSDPLVFVCLLVLVFFFFFFFCFFTILLRVKNILALVYLKINFPANILKINNQLRQMCHPPTPPPPPSDLPHLQNLMVAPLAEGNSSVQVKASLKWKLKHFNFLRVYGFRRQNSRFCQTEQNFVGPNFFI